MVPLLKPGDKFAGRYRVVQFLAQGGFGSVFVAEHTITEMEVAIKVFSPNLFSSSHAQDRLCQEARLAAKIPSEHVVRVYDAGIDADTQLPFIVMELLKGRTLRQAVEKDAPLPFARMVHLLTQVAAGLEQAHRYIDRDGRARPIVHRDITPDNLFVVQREGRGDLVKILDFGIAKVANESIAASRDFKGTPLFMAPEQLQCMAISAQTDLWSLGLVAFFLLTGRHYWRTAALQSPALSQLMGELLTAPIEKPSVRAYELDVALLAPVGFDDWFLRCVVRDPSARFANAAELANTLQALLEDPLSALAATQRSDPPPSHLPELKAKHESKPFPEPLTSTAHPSSNRSVLVSTATITAVLLAGLFLVYSAFTPTTPPPVGHRFTPVSPANMMPTASSSSVEAPILPSSPSTVTEVTPVIGPPRPISTSAETLRPPSLPSAAGRPPKPKPLRPTPPQTTTSLPPVPTPPVPAKEPTDMANDAPKLYEVREKKH